MTKKSGSIQNTTALQARKTLLLLGVWSFVGLLTHMFRRFPSTRTLCLPSRAFPDQWPAFAEKAALHTYSTNWELISSPVVFRVLTWFPCSANKNTCPAETGSRICHKSRSNIQLLSWAFSSQYIWYDFFRECQWMIGNRMVAPTEKFIQWMDD